MSQTLHVCSSPALQRAHHTLLFATSVVIALALTGCSFPSTSVLSTSPTALQMQGRVMGGSQPISHAVIQMFAAGTQGAASPSIPLLTAPAVTDSQGSFSITGRYTCPSATSPIYFTATGGNPGLAAGANNSAIALMASVGACGNLLPSTTIMLNEASTVTAVWPASPYMASSIQVGVDPDSPNLNNAFVASAVLSDITAGSALYPGIVIPDQAPAIRSLANSLAACVSSDGSVAEGAPCAQLFSAATPAGGQAPADTLQAALNIALHPAANVSAIFTLSIPQSPFQPALTTAPSDWTLGLTRPLTSTFNHALNVDTAFMGDSITAEWALPIVNLGVSGQYAGSMLARFQDQVVGHGYARVVILAGTNNIWHPGGPPLSEVLGQIQSMALIARAAGIEVVLCQLPQMSPYGVDLNQDVAPFNASLAELAALNNYLIVDYYSPTLGHPEYFRDGVHPNTDGFNAMEAALAAVVRQ